MQDYLTEEEDEDKGPYASDERVADEVQDFGDEDQETSDDDFSDETEDGFEDTEEVVSDSPEYCFSSFGCDCCLCNFLSGF